MCKFKASSVSLHLLETKTSRDRPPHSGTRYSTRFRPSPPPEPEPEPGPVDQAQAQHSRSRIWPRPVATRSVKLRCCPVEDLHVFPEHPSSPGSRSRNKSRPMAEELPDSSSTLPPFGVYVAAPCLERPRTIAATRKTLFFHIALGLILFLLERSGNDDFGLGRRGISACRHTARPKRVVGW